LTNIPNDQFDKILRSVHNPSAYLGTELNSVRKSPKETTAAVALAFPDLYDIGMSHLGLKILYGVVNSQPDLAAERVFAPALDFAAALRERRTPLMSLESRRPLADFDFVGFTIPYELCFTTILWMLDLAHIPLRAKDRNENHPLIIGGGAGVYNPEPVAPFFDLFFLGEAEKQLPPILRAGARKSGKSRAERIDLLASMDGVYIPSLFSVEHKPDGAIAAIAPARPEIKHPRRVALASMAESDYPLRPVIPFGKPTHDRLTVEIDRGCVQGCRFCQAGTTYRPARERTPEQVMGIFDKALPATGYSEISLTSLSAGDYSQTGKLLTLLMDKYSGGKVAVSLPSLRPGSVTNETIEQIKRVRRTGFTITAEAGTQRLRQVINKKVTQEEIERCAIALLENGWRGLKLYFMIGLPTETMEDVEAIADLAIHLSRLKSPSGGKFFNLNVSASNFVPKPHTAFQWVGQDTTDTLAQKKERLFQLIRPHKKIKLKWTDPLVSRLEAVFSRGDRRLADVVEEAYRMGARLDPWTEHRNMGAWEAAFATCGLDPQWYASRTYALDDILPWSHLDTGLTDDYFKKEFALAMKGETTEDCKVSRCLLCGLDPKTCFKPYESAPAQAPVTLPSPPPDRFKYRLTYHKKDDAKFHSHLETMAIIQRAFKVAGLPVASSEGMHPQPRISFGPALPLGVESAQELFDVEITSYQEPWAMASRLNSRLPAGFSVVDAGQIGVGVKSINSITKSFTFRIRFEKPPTRERLEEAVARFLALTTAPVQREGKKSKDIRPLVQSLVVEPESLDIIFTTSVSQTHGFARHDDLMLSLFPEGDIVAARVVKLSAEMG